MEIRDNLDTNHFITAEANLSRFGLGFGFKKKLRTLEYENIAYITRLGDIMPKTTNNKNTDNNT